MANIKSQKKRVLTNEKAHKRNVAVKSSLKTAVRATREAIAAGDKAAAEAAYKVAAQKLDKAAGAGVIHKNQAANRKSGLAVAINALRVFVTHSLEEAPQENLRGFFFFTFRTLLKMLTYA